MLKVPSSSPRSKLNIVLLGALVGSSSMETAVGLTEVACVICFVTITSFDFDSPSSSESFFLERKFLFYFLNILSIRYLMN